MTFILKPIFWNTGGYRHPSGVKANSGYPFENGFGHEEWNNSDRLRFERDEVAYRAFHTEGIGNLAEADEAITVFMYASHDGVQELVGIAGDATALMAPYKKKQRYELAKRLRVDRLADDAWRILAVQRCFNQSRDRFNRAWSDGEGSGWIPNWFAPSDQFMWFDPPIRLDPKEITGKANLNYRFTSHTQISPEQAAIVMEHVPIGLRNEAWRRISAGIRRAEPDALEDDLQNVWDRDDIPATTKDALVKSRLGQGRFRARLEQRWEDCCAVTGCAIREVLRASHIKRWADSTDAERLDPANGLLLIANLDCLFDRGVISFSDDGHMLVSEVLSEGERQLLQVPENLRLPLNRHEIVYLAHHRQKYGFADQ